MDRNSVDERLVRRGELSQPRVCGWLRWRVEDYEPWEGWPPLRADRKVCRVLVGCPLPLRVSLRAAWRIHQLNRLVPKLPSADYSGLRRRILELDLQLGKSLRLSDEPVIVAVDSTGVRVHKAGGWVERKYGNKKRYIKIHLAVDVETKQALAMIVTTDGTHDSRVFPQLLRKTEMHGEVSKVYADGAYDSSKIYNALESKGIEAVIKPRRNSRLDTPSEPRGRAVTMYKRLGHKRWKELKGYGKRWSVETAYSTFRRAFGEFCMAKTMTNITKELAAKAYLYNMLINL